MAINADLAKPENGSVPKFLQVLIKKKILWISLKLLFFIKYILFSNILIFFISSENLPFF